MFVKYWEPGRVKTRLAKRIGARPAAVIYRSFVAALVTRFALTGDDRVLCFAPPSQREAFIKAGGSSWRATAQTEGDLGRRMTTFFEQTFARGAERVVLIGSDSPDLPIEYVQQAFRTLEHDDVVLGPTEDGGYYLVGMSGLHVEIFAGIDWSTASVWQQTTERITAANLTSAHLPRWYDVDEAADLARLRARLSAAVGTDTSLAELLAVLNEVE